MSVSTMGGEWSTTKYDIVKDGAKEVGVDIELNFNPKDPVDSKMIGLTQTVKPFNEGAPNPSNDHKKSQMIKDEGPGKGTYVDRLKDYGNPIYPTEKPGAHDELKDTPTNDFWGQNGFHHKEGGAPKHQKAILKDTPQRPARTKNAGQIFETAALSLDGPQKNAYYGTVQWGWTADDTGAFKKLPLTLVSMGVPTGTFMKAADIWNKSKTSEGDDTLDLPISHHRSHDVCYTDEGLKKKIAELELTAKTSTDPNVQFELTYLKKEQEDRQKAAPKGKDK